MRLAASGGEPEGRAVAVRGRPRHSVESRVRQFVDDPKAGSARGVRGDRERHGAFKERGYFQVTKCSLNRGVIRISTF